MNPGDTCYEMVGSRWMPNMKRWVSRRYQIPHDLQPDSLDADRATCVYCGMVMTRDRAGGGSGD